MGRAAGTTGPRITQTGTKVFAAGRSVHFVEFPPEHRESDRLWNRLPLVGVVTKPPQMPVAESGQGGEDERGFPGGQAGESPGKPRLKPCRKPASRPANRSETRPKAAKKNSIDPFFDFAWGSNYFACLPEVGAIPRALRPCLWGVASALEGPSIWYLFRIARPLTRHPSSQGKATDPWAFSRSARSASSATSSAGRHWLARSSGFRDFLSAGWGSRGGRTVERAGEVRAEGGHTARAAPPLLRRAANGAVQRRVSMLALVAAAAAAKVGGAGGINGAWIR